MNDEWGILSGKFKYAYFSSDVKGEVRSQHGKYTGGVRGIALPFL